MYSRRQIAIVLKRWNHLGCASVGFESSTIGRLAFSNVFRHSAALLFLPRLRRAGKPRHPADGPVRGAEHDPNAGFDQAAGSIAVDVQDSPGGLAGPEPRPADLDAKRRFVRRFQVTSMGRDNPRQQRESQGMTRTRGRGPSGMPNGRSSSGAWLEGRISSHETSKHPSAIRQLRRDLPFGMTRLGPPSDQRIQAQSQVHRIEIA